MSVSHCGEINHIMEEMGLNTREKVGVLQYIYCPDNGTFVYELVNIEKPDVEELIKKGVKLFLVTNKDQIEVDLDYLYSSDYSKKQWDKKLFFKENPMQKKIKPLSAIDLIISTAKDTRMAIEWILSKKLSSL